MVEFYWYSCIGLKVFWNFMLILSFIICCIENNRILYCFLFVYIRYICVIDRYLKVNEDVIIICICL